MNYEDEGQAGDWEYDDYDSNVTDNYTYTTYPYSDYTDEPVYEDSSSTAAHSSTASGQNFIEFKVAKILWVYVGSAIIAVGTAGHVMSVLVLLGSKRMRLLSLTVFLVATSLAGLAALYVGLLRQVVLNESGWTVDVRDHVSDGGCRLHAVLTYMSLQLYLWLQATIAVERTIAVMRPLRYKLWCTWRRNLIAVAAIVVLLALFNAILAFIYRIDPDGRCTESPDKRELFQVVWGHVDLVLYSIFPTAVIVPCNVITLQRIYRSQVDGQSRGRRNAPLTAMLVAHNCVCVATTLPISVIFLMPWPKVRDSPENARRELEWTVFSLLQYLGTTFSFVIYSTSARRFRRAVVDLFSRGFNVSNTMTTSLSSSRRNSSAGAAVASRNTASWQRRNAGGGSSIAAEREHTC